MPLVYTYCTSKGYIYCIIVESGFEVLPFTFTSSRLTKPCSYVCKTVFKKRCRLVINIKYTRLSFFYLNVANNLMRSLKQRDTKK